MNLWLILLLAAQLSRAEFLEQARQTRVVYLGEHHDRELDHRGQRQLLDLLDPQAVGLEMYERRDQPWLDRASLEELRAQWSWGYPWALYAPLIEWARDQGAHLLGLNAPREEVRRVSRGESPPPAGLEPGVEAYRRKLEAVWREHQGPPDGFERFFMAQCLWDQTMADSLADWLTQHPEGRVAVIVGAGHVEHGYGIPSRLSRRLPGVTQLKVLFGAGEPGAADYVWTPDS